MPDAKRVAVHLASFTLNDAASPRLHRPSFNDAETVKANVRQLSDGETVSVAGTHLGHNLPEYATPAVNRYCIDLVSIAGFPSASASAAVAAAGDAAAAGDGARKSQDECPFGVAVYVGNGCFWHTQYDFYNLEIDPKGSASPFNHPLFSTEMKKGELLELARVKEWLLFLK